MELITQLLKFEAHPTIYVQTVPLHQSDFDGFDDGANCHNAFQLQFLRLFFATYLSFIYSFDIPQWSHKHYSSFSSFCQ
jgi:hypothetical protein